MIKASELRIGNKVISKTHNILNATIDGILSNKGIFLLKEVSTYETELDPIPLTSKILKKCGFKDQTYGKWSAFAYKDTPICAHWDGVEWCFKYGYDSDLTIAACGHLHQAQNLIFALTGKEIEIRQ